MNSLNTPPLLQFPTDIRSIWERIESIDPLAYGRSRNFIDGAVSYLSPYISRGVVSTRQVFEFILNQGYELKHIEKFIQELTWRDYWQQVWLAKGEEINSDLRHPQEAVSNWQIPKAIVEGNTGIEAIDIGIKQFYQTGYLHNHLRMYIASMACNLGRSHWKVPAQWMFYHLLDGDWASNALSWQWVAGANSNKKYYANQENINKYCHSLQRRTFLDIDYDQFSEMTIPDRFRETIIPKLATHLPEKTAIYINPSLPTLIYNEYNLDPEWRKEEANRILLLEPSRFKAYPFSQKTLNFILDLSKNIPNIQVFVGEFSELKRTYQLEATYFKEHPLNKHYIGYEDPRDWIFEVRGYYRSFFAFWKKCNKELSSILSNN